MQPKIWQRRAGIRKIAQARSLACEDQAMGVGRQLTNVMLIGVCFLLVVTEGEAAICTNFGWTFCCGFL